MFGPIKALGFGQAFDALAHLSAPAADRLWAETTYLAEIARNTADLRHLVEDTRNLINASAAPSTAQLAAVAEGPAWDELRAHTCAGHQTLTRDDLMDAARAVHAFSHQSHLHPAARPYWESLGARIENAAIAAAK
ncbi:hypothetical protein BN000_00605 [Mycobacterium europaeum]|uniref:Uncharacterized protein n=1 Tax=Mycobacterium europaeum TaxID=761804 RepID=A0A0U1CX08_9MYCO|nr:hypothetical protein [Mycobacterium europaeum]CQD03624.1 hypothetical protein BN000_00605 [Mycobacterium europaeum]